MPDTQDTTIPQLISVTDLRDRIGGPTSDPTAPGGISDAQLQSIINEVEQEINDAFEQKVVTTDFDTLPDHLIQAHDVTVGTSSQDNPNLAQGDIPQSAYPISKKAWDGNGNELSYDPKIDVTAANTSWYEPRRYYLDDRTLYVYPDTITSVTVLLPDKDELVSVLMGQEIANANNRIIQKARNMLKARTQEGRILEGSSLNEEGFES